jgi:hypothetical protein
MKKSEAAKRIQIFLENRGYHGNSDDGEALIDFLTKEIEMLPPFTYLKKIGTLDTAWEPEDEQDKI